MIKRAIVVVPLVLALAACGDDDSSSGSGGGDSSDWCSFAQGVEDDFTELNALDPTDTASFQEIYTGIAERLDGVADDAPEEIRDDVQTLSRGFNTLIDELEKVDFDIFQLDSAVLDDMDQEMSAAQDNIERYNETECGITPDEGGDETDTTDDASDATLPASGSVNDMIRDQFVAMGMTEEQAECLLENIDVAEFSQTQDVNQMMEAFGTCDIDMTQLGGG